MEITLKTYNMYLPNPNYFRNMKLYKRIHVGIMIII